jgi:hypothetical protein
MLFPKIPLVLALALAGWLVAFDVAAQSGGQFAITRSVISGGGGTSSGGPYVLSGTIGQPATGVAEGGAYSVSAGFWIPESLTLATPPLIFAPMKIGGQFQISFHTILGRTYLVEFTDSLLQPTWQTLPGITGTGAPETVIDPVPGVDQRFYRVRVE